MSEERDLWLFTASFPYGNDEAFLESEIPVLAQRFRRVHIHPLKQHDGLRPLPANVVVHPIIADIYQKADLRDLWRHRRSVARILRSLLRDAPSLAALWRDRGELLSRIRSLVHRVNLVERALVNCERPVVLYSYWMHDWATVLVLANGRKPHLPVISRAHGYDLYADRNAQGWVPFRRLQMIGLDRISCISMHGGAYLRAAHPAQAKKIKVSHLGTADHGMGPWSATSVLRLVSCSRLIPLKRVDLIVESLKHTTVPVEWTHFGHGPGAAAMAELVQELPANVRATLHGETPNHAIMAHYRTQPVDLFIHLSGHEGLPVVLMEAASFGVPLMACDVGGVPEIVHERTGVLLAKQPDPRHIGTQLDAFLEGPMHTVAFRAGVRTFWSNEFDAIRNFERFCDDLSSI